MGIGPVWWDSNINDKFRGSGGDLFKPNILPKFKGQSGGGLIDDSKSFFENANDVMNHIKAFFDWLAHWKENALDITISTLAWVYDFLSNFILSTPSWLFSGEWFVKISFIFAGVSVFLTALLGIAEGIKAMLNQRHTSAKRVLTRLPFAVLATGFAPFAFQYGFEAVNKVSSTIVHVGKSIMKVNTDTLTVNILGIQAMDAITLLAFDAMLVASLVPLTLTLARRWFDLLALGGLTPVAFTSWIFDDYNHYFSAWWNTIKRTALVQVYYAGFITIIGIMILGVHQTSSVWSLLLKLLVIAGGLWRMANPPAIVRRHMDNGAQVDTMYRQTMDGIKFKNLRKTIKGMQITPSKNKKPVLRTHREGRVKREKLIRKISKWFKKK